MIAVSVGPEEVDESLRKCLAKGADRAIRVWDAAIEGSDPIAIARVLAVVAMREAPDMMFAGVQSSDQAFAATGIATAAFLHWPHAAVVSKLSYSPGAKTAVFRRELEGGLLQEVEIQCPAVLTIQLGINTPRYASLRSIKQAAAKPIEVLSMADLCLVDLNLSDADVGEAGSLSRVRRMYLPEKGRAQLIEGDASQQARASGARSSVNSRGRRHERDIGDRRAAARRTAARVARIGRCRPGAARRRGRSDRRHSECGAGALRRGLERRRRR